MKKKNNLYYINEKIYKFKINNQNKLIYDSDYIKNKYYINNIQIFYWCWFLKNKKINCSNLLKMHKITITFRIKIINISKIHLIMILLKISQLAILIKTTATLK